MNQNEALQILVNVAKRAVDNSVKEHEAINEAIKAFTTPPERPQVNLRENVDTAPVNNK